MGNRISIAFTKDGDESVALFSHWDGQSLVEEAKNYIKLLKKFNEEQGSQVFPLNRMEPQTVMVDFMRHLLRKHYDKEMRVTSNYYLGRDGNDGDNSDNGHFKLELD